MLNVSFFIYEGDHPERQFESGNLQGGNHPCICGAKVTRI